MLGNIYTLKNKKESDYYCGAGFRDLSIDINGNIYPCFMFNGESKFVMGNVISGTDMFFNKRDIYLCNKIDKNENCNKCWVKNVIQDIRDASEFVILRMKK